MFISTWREVCICGEICFMGRNVSSHVLGRRVAGMKMETLAISMGRNVGMYVRVLGDGM